MTNQFKDPDLQFLNENRQRLFKGRNHYLGILHGEIEVPEIPADIPDELDNLDLSVLSFGQFIAYKADALGLSISELAQTLHISVHELTKIYEDETFPWDLSVDFIQQIAEGLRIPITVLVSAIQNYSPSDELLRSRLPQQSLAARTPHTLDEATRKNELIEAQVTMQRHKELQKRQTFISALEQE